MHTYKCAQVQTDINSPSYKQKQQNLSFLLDTPLFFFFLTPLFLPGLTQEPWCFIYAYGHSYICKNFFFFFFFFIFCHTLERNSHGFTCVPHLDPPSHLPLHPIPLGFPSAPGPSACLMHPTWAGDLFHPRYYTCFDAVLLKHPTPSFSHRV